MRRLGGNACPGGRRFLAGAGAIFVHVGLAALAAFAPFAPFAAIAALAPVAALTAGCTRGRSGPSTEGEGARDFGSIAAPVPGSTDVLGYLALARGILERSSPEGIRSPEPAHGAPRRVVLAFWPPGGPPLVATGSGPTLADSVARAAEALQPQIANPQSGRLEIDVPTAFEVASLDELGSAAPATIGFEGVLLARDDGRTGCVLPGEIAQRHLFRPGSPARFDGARIASIAARRAGVSESDAASMRAYKFRADAHVESSRHDAALSLARGVVAAPADAGPARLLSAVKSGADYLTRALGGDGRYIYLYHPDDDRNDPSYGWLRHAGTTYALFEAYEELGSPTYLEKGELALRYLASHLTDHPPSQGKYLLDTNDEEEQGVGGAGLALLAFARHAAITGKRTHLETMRALARYVIHRQYGDGHFRSNADVERETGKKTKREPIYYTGEAVLGLMRLFAIDPQPAYLEAARQGASWVVRVRDAAVSEDNQEHDHWMAYALNELFRATRDTSYLDHARKIARAIQKKQHGADAPAPDLAGTFYDGQSAPAATRLEAYDAYIVLARFAAQPEEWLLAPAKRVACSILGQQFDAENDYWLKNPGKAEGGVRESPIVDDVRIDYVQHALSGWLHLARILRDGSYGKTGVPSQDAVRGSDAERAGGKGQAQVDRPGSAGGQ
ncbi:MAG: hypothetical protein M3O50_16270 [Myxococcota bacterium]|nr:hypothetical protein [Myxococcota bacterium]